MGWATNGKPDDGQRGDGFTSHQEHGVVFESHSNRMNGNEGCRLAEVPANNNSSEMNSLQKYFDGNQRLSEQMSQQNQCLRSDELYNGPSCKKIALDPLAASGSLSEFRKQNHTAVGLSPNDKLNRIDKRRICYDFKKGHCRRRFCRYPHVMNNDQIVFCHDFQNSSCFRSTCRFIHRSIEDEEFYRVHGHFPSPQEPAPTSSMARSHLPTPSTLPNLPGNDVRYRNEVPMYPSSSSPSSSPTAYPLQPISIRRRSHGMSNSPNEGNPSKRLIFDDRQGFYNSLESAPPNFQPHEMTSSMNSLTPKSVPSFVIGEDVINIYRLYEEHNLLRRRVEINEERLHEIKATNTFLLHQNEQLRRQCSCTSTIVNPVTLTSTSQSATPQVHGVAVSIAPVQVQATPIVSIAGPPTQIITTTNCQPIAIAATSQGQQIITTNQTQGQQLIATNTSQGQQLIAASTSQGQQLIAANTSQGQQLIAANTSQAQQIALASSQPAHASQILGTSQITIAPAASMGLAINTSQPLAMSANATQPIISYPIMTHSILPH